MTKKVAVFDVDGTILDSFGFFQNAVVHYSEQAGLQTPCFESIRKGYHDPLAHDYKWGVTREEQRTHLGNTFRLMDEWSQTGHPDKTPAFYDGAIAALDSLRDHGFTLAIVTSKPEAPLLQSLELHGVLDHFAAYRTWDDVKKRGEREKPAPDMLQSVLRDLGADAENAVMIGDTTMDIEMGHAAKTHTMAVTWGAHPVELLRSVDPHHVVDTHFSDLEILVKKILG